MKKNIWIMNHYAGSMFFDKGGRHYNFAKYLRREGYAPVVFCANSKHGQPEVFFNNQDLWHEYMAEEIDTPFVFIKTRTYQGNGKQRVRNMIDFYCNVKKVAKQYGKPDVIYASSVHPLTLVAGIQLAKYFGVKCICEVRDPWPESIVAYSSHLTEKNLVIKILYQGEKWIYQKADAVVFTGEGGCDYINEKGWERKIPLSKIYHINNGVDLEAFEYNREHFHVEDPDLDNPELFKVVYTGSIRHVNNLGLLLDVAKQVTDPKVRFLVWGDGDERPMLERRLREEGLDNVIFKGRVAKPYIPYIVSKADLNFVHNAPSPLFRFGISFNKIFDYLAAGRPVLCDFTSSYNPVIQHCAGMDVSYPTPTSVAEAVLDVVNMDPERYQAYCDAAKAAAHEYDFKNLTQKLVSILEEV